MIGLLLTLAFAPWSRALAFQPLAGWRTGASGNLPSQYNGRKKPGVKTWESTAWMRYLDSATADPPNKTLAQLPKQAVIVWAVIYSPDTQQEHAVQLDFRKAKRYACCVAALIPAEYDLTGSGPHDAYSVIVRIYFGSQPSARSQAVAQQALSHLRLPSAR